MNLVLGTRTSYSSFCIILGEAEVEGEAEGEAESVAESEGYAEGEAEGDAESESEGTKLFSLILNLSLMSVFCFSRV